MAAGGYLASKEQWDQFEIEWGAILNAADVDEFHATDFYACRHKWKEWERDTPEHKDFGERFASAAYRHLERGFGFGIDLYHFDDVLASKAYKKIKTPHGRMQPDMYVVAQICMHAARTTLLPNGLQAAILIEGGDGVGEIIGWLKHLKKTDPWMKAFTSFTVVPKSAYPVQAADLLAYETGMEIEAALDAPDRTFAETRGQFKVLAGGSPALVFSPGITSKIHVHQSGFENFQQTVRNLRQFVASQPEKYGWTHAELRRDRARKRKRMYRALRSFIVGKSKRFYFRVLRRRGR